MQYRCENCRKEFEFPERIAFCPFCGSTLCNGSAIAQTPEAEKMLAETVDNIWGAAAMFRNSFSEAVLGCVNLINCLVNTTEEKILARPSISDYEKAYESFQKCGDRKTLIARIDRYVQSINSMIDKVDDEAIQNLSNKAKAGFEKAIRMADALYAFLGSERIDAVQKSFDGTIFSAEILYSKDQLHNLYDLVLVAFGKYKRCVEDNNMFAAFASTSDYGTINHWYGYMYGTGRVNASGEDSLEYDEVIEHMTRCNSERYLGFLDEDFVPHVDAFWFGLENLCRFIDCSIEVKFDMNCCRISDIESARLARMISTGEYQLDRSKVDEAEKFRADFEKSVSDD